MEIDMTQTWYRKAKRVASWARGRKVGPVRMELHPTDRCNLKCRFCWQAVANENFSNEMSEERLISIVKEAKALGVEEWIISGGGEPMVRKNITMRILKLIKEYGMWGQLTTNGTLFKNEDVITLIKIGWDQLQISIDAPDAETHDYLRAVSGAFDRAVHTSELFSFYKKKLGSDKPYLGFNVVLSCLIYDRLKSLIELAHKVGFQLVWFEPIYGGYLLKERLTLNEEEEQKLPGYIKEAEEFAKQVGVDTNISRFLRSSLVDKSNFKDVVIREVPEVDNPYISAPCYQPWFLMGVKGSGIAGCCSTFQQGVDIHHRTIKDAWFSEDFDKIRENMLKRKIPEWCSKCSVVVMMENKEIRERLREILGVQC